MESSRTTRLPTVSGSIAPPLAGTRATYCARSSSTRKKTALPSGDQSGDDTDLSREPVSTVGVPPSTGTIASLFWLYA